MSEPPARLTALDDPTFRLAAKTRARAHQQRLDAGEIAAPFRVGLAGTFTLDPLVPFVVDALLAVSIEPEIRMAPYGQVVQACLDPLQALAVDAPGRLDAIVLLWRFEDWLRPELDAWIAGDLSAPARAESRIQELARAVAGLREQFSGTIVAAIPPFPDPPTLDLFDPQTPPSLFARLRLAWIDATRAIPSLHDLDLDAVQRYCGAARSRDARRAYLYRQPYDEVFVAVAGDRIGATLAATRVAPRKCLALDADGTLWGGIVGEDGPEGIDIGEDYPGSAYRDFQTLLRRWKDRGVLLTLLSKNTEADVWSVFVERREMRLRREDFAAWRIDWQPKADNLPRLAAELGIDVSAFVFIDDNPREIAQMRAAWPEVLSILVPEDPADLVDTVLAHRLFDAAHTTDEDRRRTAMAAAESRRRDDRARLSPEEFLASLDLVVRVGAAEASDLPRVAQLVAKTNQFNLTTIRRSADELRALIHAGDHHVLVLSASDRFGDHGLVGVAIVRTGPTCELDTFLLSCRVLGRGVESAFLAAIADVVARLGGTRLLARFIPTAKNAPAAAFLDDHGFAARDGVWTIDVTAIRPAPPHITLTQS